MVNACNRSDNCLKKLDTGFCFWVRVFRVLDGVFRLLVLPRVDAAEREPLRAVGVGFFLVAIRVVYHQEAGRICAENAANLACRADFLMIN